MRCLFLLLLLAASLAAGRGGPQPSTPWVLYSFGNGQQYTPSGAAGIDGDIATFNFPKAKGNAKFPTFLTTIVDTNILGDLAGKTLLATLEISVIGNPIFVYGGQGDWNNCPSPPANARLYFSTNAAGFNLQESVQHENGYWWSHTGVVIISATTGLATISDTFAPEHWSNANGHAANENQAYTDAFNAAIANVRQIGVACSGACFFDVGVAIQNISGTAATFHLISYSAD